MSAVLLSGPLHVPSRLWLPRKSIWQRLRSPSVRAWVLWTPGELSSRRKPQARFKTMLYMNEWTNEWMNECSGGSLCQEVGLSSETDWRTQRREGQVWGCEGRVFVWERVKGRTRGVRSDGCMWTKFKFRFRIFYSRWSQAAKAPEKTCDNMTGDVLISSGVISYLRTFTSLWPVVTHSYMPWTNMPSGVTWAVIWDC